MSFIKFITSKTFLKQIALAILAVVVLVILIMQYLKVTTNHGEFVLVPDLSKKSLREVEEIMEKADLNYVVLDSTNYNPDYPRFSVIEQDPSANKEVKEGRKIYLTINPSGYRKVSVPNVIQVTKRNAESMLKAVGLNVGKVTYVNEIGKDMVYYVRYEGKNILPGHQLPKTTEVELVCGNGNRANVSVE
ncbi:PASTA domain-containing protein [Galbibacter pacificus]|uniref:PASTA domain-containing protein n=1 Tax=Galbibacter pacificus TaxID=2996052 RepID=A0ABT6FW84_9FLAO|nr:PASTA domain-containing protein [Galbibacter pacificus]MDG3583718.1 PASTA domain-containing protein [Galbibacter pacificus]MDG3587364.1 PASTA domain-containing protein [Galbibacter pacificus]